MNDKDSFIKSMKLQTKRFAVDIIEFCNSLKVCKSTSVITYQLIKSATSTGANYRAACNARSKKEFLSKICIVVEEADESAYWLEIISEAKLSSNESDMNRLHRKACEIVRIMSKAKNSLLTTMK